MRTETEVRKMIKSISEEMEMLNNNPPEDVCEYTEMMDELEHLHTALQWVLGEINIGIYSY